MKKWCKYSLFGCYCVASLVAFALLAYFNFMRNMDTLYPPVPGPSTPYEICSAAGVKLPHYTEKVRDGEGSGSEVTCRHYKLYIPQPYPNSFYKKLRKLVKENDDWRYSNNKYYYDKCDAGVSVTIEIDYKTGEVEISKCYRDDMYY